jgi:hypothetical protein
MEARKVDRMPGARHWLDRISPQLRILWHGSKTHERVDPPRRRSATS